MTDPLYQQEDDEPTGPIVYSSRTFDMVFILGCAVVFTLEILGCWWGYSVLKAKGYL
jgi:hypothetical protein